MCAVLWLDLYEVRSAEDRDGNSDRGGDGTSDDDGNRDGNWDVQVL